MEYLIASRAFLNQRENEVHLGWTKIKRESIADSLYI